MTHYINVTLVLSFKTTNLNSLKLKSVLLAQPIRDCGVLDVGYCEGQSLLTRLKDSQL